MSSPSLIGKQLDEYRLEAMLGEGGMASVYRALDVRLNRYVAVKVIRTTLRAESEYSMRFEREAQAIAQLDHPNIITLYRFGEKDGLLYMAMQYVDGADLAAVIASFRKDGDYVEFEEVIRVAHEIGAALDYAHAHGVIHRDIKPHNIMINRDGRVLVADFGLALMTEIGTHGDIFGSPHYIAPEQAISSAGVVPQSDLYAMGVVLYEMLTGTVPFDAAEVLDVAMKHMSDPVPSPREHRPELSEAVEQVLYKALEKEPAERYATGKELANALEAALHRPSRPVRSTITSKVALERAADPLPPVPPAVMPTTQPHQAPVTRQAQQVAPPPPPTEKKPSYWLLYGIAGVSVLALLALILVLTQAGSDDDDISQSTLNAAAPTNTTEPIVTESIPAAVQPTITTVVTEIPSALSESTHDPTPTLIDSSVIPTSIPVQGIPTSSSSSLIEVPDNSGDTQILTNGYGLTTGKPVTNGEFEVEGYCQILNQSYGVTEDGMNWYCTQNGERVRTLTNADFSDICRLTYDEPDAQAIQTAGSAPTAYLWRCYYMPIPQSAVNTSQSDGSPSAATQSYVIVIRWHQEDSLFITNITRDLPFPLPPLSLRGSGQIGGEEWGVSHLANSQCVAVWKDSGNPRPADTSCTLVGNRVMRDGPDRFWKSGFTVVYNGTEITTCDSTPCIVQIQS